MLYVVRRAAQSVFEASRDLQNSKTVIIVTYAHYSEAPSDPADHKGKGG